MVLRAGIAAQLLAVACIAAAIHQRNHYEIEGAYFNRAEGDPTGAFAVSEPGILGWLIAAMVLIVAGTVLLVRARRSREP